MKKQEALEIISRNSARLKEFQVKALFLFGSVVRDNIGPDSDIDVLVEFLPEDSIGLFELVRLQRFLTEILGRRADIATPDALHSMLREDIERELVRAA